MDDVVTKPGDRLYDQDFYAWTQAQAAILRSGRLDRADIANILEEIETLGRKEVAELRSRLKVLAQHLLKEMIQPEKASRSWRTTIIDQRQKIARHIADNPSLKAKQAAIFLQAYQDARAPAGSETDLPLDLFPAEPPFSLRQSLDPSFWPGRSHDDRG